MPACTPLDGRDRCAFPSLPLVADRFCRSCGRVPGDDTEGEPEHSRLAGSVWVVLVDIDGTPWGGALVNVSDHFVTLVVPTMHDAATNRDIPQHWIQLGLRQVARIHEVDELTACAVGLQRQAPFAFHVGIDDLAALAKRIQA